MSELITEIAEKAEEYPLHFTVVFELGRGNDSGASQSRLVKVPDTDPQRLIFEVRDYIEGSYATSKLTRWLSKLPE